MSEFFIPPQNAPGSELLPIQPVSVVRSVAMAEVRKHARRVNVSSDPKAHRFVLYDDSGGEVGSDLTDTFLGISIARSGYRQHTMRISFLEMLLSEANRYSNYREVYMFDWRDGERVFGRKRTIENRTMIIETKVADDGAIIDVVDPQKIETVEVIDLNDCEALCERMIGVAESIRQKVA
jgi:hypothetical protein